MHLIEALAVLLMFVQYHTLEIALAAGRVSIWAFVRSTA